MTTVERSLLRSSGEPRPRASAWTDLVTTVLAVWMVLGLFLDAWAHVTVPELETFFTPGTRCSTAASPRPPAGCSGR